MAKGKYEYWLTPDGLTRLEAYARDGLTDEQERELLAEPQRYFYIGKEKQYEEYIKESIPEICHNLGLPEVIQVASQQTFDTGTFIIRPDLIAFHSDGSLSVFEVKCNNGKYPSSGVGEQARAIGQLLLYKNVLEEIRGDTIRVFLVDQKIYKRTVCVFAQIRLPVTLVEVQNDRVFIPYKQY
jgi:hypothetical protein